MLLNNRGEGVFSSFSLNFYVMASKFLLLAFFIFTTFIFSFSVSFAATLQTEWIDQFGSVEDVYDVSYTIDSDGDMYIAGAVKGTLPGQTSAGEEDAFVRKYDPQGNILWTRQFGTASYDGAFAITVNETGVYVSGSVSNALPGQTYLGYSDVFVRKYDTNGNEIWTRQFGTSEGEESRTITVDSSGVYVGGVVIMALPEQTFFGSSDGFVRKYDVDGNEIWTRQFGTNGGEAIENLMVNSTNVYITGGTNGAFPGKTNAGSEDVFIRKYDTDGNYFWTQQFGTTGMDRAFGIVSDGSSLYVSGFLLEGALPGQTASGDFDSFIRKCDFDGNAIWTRQFGTANYDGAFALAIDPTGVYMGGDVDGALPGQTDLGGWGDAYIRKYDFNGNEIWTHQFGTAGYEEILGLYADGTDVYATGYTSGSFPGFTLVGPFDAFVIKLWQDSDDDFIYDGVDTQPATTSDDFDDGDGTTGTITTRGDQILTIIDSATSSDGVYVVADLSGGSATATLSVCDDTATYDFTPGDEATITCGSAIINVVSGPIEALYTAANNAQTSAVVPTGNSVTFDSVENTFTALATNQDTIELSVEGEVIDLSPGETVELGNEVPVAGDINAPLDPNNIANAISVNMPFTDPDASDTHSAVWDWGDGTQCDTSVDVDCSVTESNGVGTTTATHTYSTPGVYTLTVNISDGELTASSTFQYIVVYDPEGGFVTGGGWFDSLEGAYAPDTNLTGKANFGFVSKYHNGAQIPSGETQFQFKVADFRFHSDEYQWLVVNNAKAQYKGDGTVNGGGDYGFMLTTIDGALTQQGDDLFRIKIWDKTTDEIVYDNKMDAEDDADPTTGLGGGSIVIHED